MFKCPMAGQMKVMNTAPDYKMMMMFPDGTYRIIFNAFNSDDEHIALVSTILKIEA
jgi:hypothetical protein